MKRQACETCQKPTPFKRHLGWGTFFAVVVTLGWWLLAIPFYPIRCTHCGAKYTPRRWEFTWR